MTTIRTRLLSAAAAFAVSVMLIGASVAPGPHAAPASPAAAAAAPVFA